MKAAFVKAPFQFQVRDIAIKEPSDDEALVKVMACGICGGDMNFAGVDAKEWEPFGHEIAGVIVKKGKNCSTVKEGDKVVLESGSFCGKCELCRNGRADLCNKGPNFWGNTSMGFAEYITVPKECLVPFEGMSFDEATLIEPMGVAMDLFYTADIRLNDRVLVVGAGPIGLMAIRLAKAAGAGKVYAAARSNAVARIDLAKKFGADEIILTDKVTLEEYPFGGGIDKILLTAPPQLISTCVKIAAIGGTIAYIGFADGSSADVTFNANEFHVKKLQLKASFAAPALYFPRCISMVKSNFINLKDLISHRFKLEDIGEAMSLLVSDKANSVKSVMVNE